MDKFRMEEKVALASRLKATLAVKVAKLVQLHFLTSFDKEQDPDGKPWPRRKRLVTPARKLLVKTGKLRDSLKVTSATFNLMVVESDLEYAQYHNLGTDTIPQRRFLGDSKKLEAQIKQLLEAEMKKIFSK